MGRRYRRTGETKKNTHPKRFTTRLRGQVSASLFEDISASAVSIGSIDTYNETDPSNHEAGNTVADNTIRHVGNEFLGTCGTVTRAVE